jgi:hypothetical protein
MGPTELGREGGREGGRDGKRTTAKRKDRIARLGGVGVVVNDAAALLQRRLHRLLGLLLERGTIGKFTVKSCTIKYRE